MAQHSAQDYNTRLFSSGLYGSHHRARFQWLDKQLRDLRLRQLSVLELGCFDGKSIDYIPAEITQYVGFDAGWESGTKDGAAYGLAAAQARFATDGRFQFIASTDPRDVTALQQTFDVGICMETLEHVAPEQVDSYLGALASRIRGPLFITVPNEKGAALLFKTVASKFLKTPRTPYTAKEFACAVMCRLDQVRRNEHKGFDYARLIAMLSEHFRAVTVEGIGFGRIPTSLQLTVGIVASGSKSIK